MKKPSQERFVRAPFTVLVDTAEPEHHCWRFRGIRADADRMDALFLVSTTRTPLGRHPNSLGDYSLAGGFGHVAIERKSKQDAWGTILGWQSGWEADRDLPGRRDRFEAELANLNEIDCSVVIVEATLGTLVVDAPQWGVKPGWLNGKIFVRSVLSYQQRFPRVQWLFCDTPEMAETLAFRWLYRYWEKNLKDKGDTEWDTTRKTLDSRRPADGRRF